MDKARLEEAKKHLLWLKDFGSIKKMESVEIAITLIDAAMAEPSDADVAEAIKYLEPLTKHPTLTGQYAEHLKTAITALRQMGSTKPCVACLDANHRLSMDGGMYCKYCGRPLKGGE
jgi:hypothetical protein